MLIVKNNQPKLFDALEEKFLSRRAREVDVSYNCGHGRDEKRTIETISIDPSDKITGKFNGVRQIIKITRITKDHKTYETKEHVVYAICSRSFQQLNASSLAQAIRNHWSIEVRLHGQRDVRMREDANKTRIGAAPQALACLRNWAIAIAERYQRSNSIRRISQAWQSLRYNQAEGIGTVM